MASTLQIALQNQSTASVIYAYVTGLAVQRNSELFLLESDGHTPYYPTSPPSVGSALGANCAIPLGGPGSTTTITIPQIAAGRIWFSISVPLTFALNPGPALVEPSISNPSDPNYHITWDFAELTFNSTELYANISYVDFVCLPIALTLTSTSGASQHVTGIPSTGLATISSGLQAQTASDKEGWSSLIIYNNNGTPLRAISPNNGIVMNNSLFSGYFEPYVSQVWSKYTGGSMSVNTQASFGTVSGQVENNVLNFQGKEFARPTTANIFSCSSGPFATGSDTETNAIIPRLAAAFNRSTFLETTSFPAPLSLYYKTSPTNHYSRIVHAANLDGRGYAFPYDDVAPEGGADQSGSVVSGNPKLLTVSLGGGNASSTTAAVTRVTEPQHDEDGVHNQVTVGTVPTKQPNGAASKPQEAPQKPQEAAQQPQKAPEKPEGAPQQPLATKTKMSFFQKLKARFRSKRK